jgi:recombinational DNA repair protein (RecF pathway)
MTMNSHSQTPQLHLQFSLSSFEKETLQASRYALEQKQAIRFITLNAYIDYLGKKIVARKQLGEFVPRSIEESRAGHPL